MKQPMRVLAVMLAVTAATACSGGPGGGGGGPVSPPPVSPPSPPPPPPPPPAAFFENNEYIRDYSKALIHASAAYAAGGTGAGVTIAVIDTGVDQQHAEFFGGKLSSFSIDIYSGAFTTGYFTPGTGGLGPVRNQLDDTIGHGTGVASAAAGNKLPQGDPLLATFPSGMHGVAFDATLLAIRADDSDPACAAAGCDFDTRAVAAAVDYAVANGAKVINLSLGGDPTPSAVLVQAMTRAVQAGVIIVAAAGNDGNPEPDAPSNFADDLAALGRAIAVGAVDSTSTISSFSNQAGAAALSYIVAPGEGLVVAVPVEGCGPTGNTCYNIGGAGTSFAAPQVAGAVALLLDAFPALTPESAVDIILRTATDLGNAGVDSVYGRGLLNLAAAFGPLGAGTVTFDGGQSSVPLGLLTAPPSGATGDWITASGLIDGAIMRDDYRRAFTISPEAGEAPSSALGAFEAAALGQRLDARRALSPLPGGAVGYAVFRGPEDSYIVRDNLLTDEMLTPELSLTVRQGPLSFAMGRGFAAPSVLGAPSAVTLTPAAGTGAIAALTGAGDWASLGYEMGAWSLSVRSAGDETRSFSATTLTRRLGAHRAGLEVGAATEEEAALGGAAGSRLGGEDSASTSFLALAWRGPVRGRWTGSARLEGARAALSMPSYVEVTQDPLASAWSFSLERPLTRAIDFGVTLSQPLRAESGLVAVVVPVGVTEVNASILEGRTAALTPSGREIDLETALRFDMGPGGEGRLAIRLADDPGHVETQDLESAVWLGMRWTR